MIRVTQTIQWREPPGDPVEMQWYKGESLLSATSAVTSILAAQERGDTYVEVLSVTIDLNYKE